MSKPKHPNQPLIKDKHRTVRFKRNEGIVIEAYKGRMFVKAYMVDYDYHVRIHAWSDLDDMRSAVMDVSLQVFMHEPMHGIPETIIRHLYDDITFSKHFMDMDTFFTCDHIPSY